MKRIIALIVFACSISHGVQRWAVVPTSKMDTLIPAGIPFSEKADGTQKNLREFTFAHVTYDLANGTTVFLISCNQKPYPDGSGYRQDGVTDIELDNPDDPTAMTWNRFLTAHGFPRYNSEGVELWLTTEQARLLFPVESE